MLRAFASVVTAWVCLAFVAPLRAQQFVLVDLAYTHSAENTEDSHYYPQLPANTPKDWTKPVDYAHGSVHIILDVVSKPAGDAPTKYQLCFEGSPSYGCTLQSPTYTKAGRVEWDSPFSSFWYDGTVDWTMGVQRMPMILKDDMNNKPAGDPKYMPTDLHVYVALVPAGASFVPPPPAAGSGAGGGGGHATGGASASAGMSGAPRGSRPAAGSGSAGTAANGGASAAKVASAGAGAGGSAASGGSGGAARTASGASGRDAGADGTAAVGGDRAGAGGAAANDSVPTLTNSSGCSPAGNAQPSAAWSWLTMLVLLWSTRRRATCR